MKTTAAVLKPVKGYFEFLEELRTEGSDKPQSAQYYLKKIKLLEGIISSMPAVVYIIDYRVTNYLYLSSNCEQMLGYTAAEIMQNGGQPWHIKNNIHPDDLRVFSSEVFVRFVDYTRSLAQSEFKKLRFSVNLRARRKDGVYIQALQQYVILEADESGNPLITLGTWTDITAHKTDTKVVFSVSRYDRQSGFSMISTDTFPHCNVNITNRENEIIKWLIKGQSSKGIADKLHVSLYTVNAHRRNMLKKTNCKNTAELISYAVANGLGN